MTGHGLAPFRRAAPVLAALALVVVPLLPAASGSSIPSYDTGAIRVALPSSLPKVLLSQDRNGSVGASISLDRVVELRPSSNDAVTGPTVAAVAFPSGVREYNVTSAGSTGLHLVLTATLTAYHGVGVLFPSRHLFGPQRPLVAIAPTSIRVTVDSVGASDRVLVSATVSDWPWIASDDLLALSWNFSVPDPDGFAGCAAATPGGLSTTACGSDPFAAGPSAWALGLSAFQGIGPNGPVAEVSWSDAVAIASAPAPTQVGATTAPGGAAEIVVAEPSQGAAPSQFALDYALAVPPIPSALVHGALVPYLASAAGIALVAGLAVWGVRRRGDRLTETL